jgi:DNA polymerase I-like protein with 3'-5' exonuclease and polymerase domains
MIVTIDIETTFVVKENGAFDPSPYLSGNYLVGVGYLTVPYLPMEKFFTGSNILARPEFITIYHEKLQEDHLSTIDKFKCIQKVLDDADVLIGHNIKFDLSYLLNCGFKYNGSVYDTMVCEYILARGMKRGLSLEDSCKRRDIEMPQKFIMKKYTDQGKNVNEFPLEELCMYCKGDVLASFELAKKQVEILGGTFSDFVTNS